ncbi:MAG TPA: L,D-transpeptidase family protein [Burkholderiaceae bacterium]|nr:L,D-transpeptidase family protein [Burkholderiaceae bacterium]
MTTFTVSIRFSCLVTLWVFTMVFSGFAHAQAGRVSIGTVPPVQLEAPIEMPSWFSNGTPGNDAWIALGALEQAASHGLNPADYQAEALATAFQTVRNGAGAEQLSRLDERLTTAVVRYLSDLNVGRLDPQELQHRFQKPLSGAFDARSYLAEVRQADRLDEALQKPRENIPMYEALRSMMNEYRAMGDHPAWLATLPPLQSRSLKPGAEWSGLPIVAARLGAMGDLPRGIPTSTLYDGALVEAVRRFQERHGLETDGVLGRATLVELNVTPAQRVKQMALTLERLRWTPLLRGPRMIVVNIPEFMLRAYEVVDGKVEIELEMRVVVGRALDTRTPIFLEDMRSIEFSPYWNVPLSIARGETLPRLRRDPGYFSREGFEIVTRDGRVVNELTDDAIAAVQRGEWRIRQRPGPRNSLGDIKFIFPNDQNIYLHHTPSTGLFPRARRDFSHGCIRVEMPLELARFALKLQPEWTPKRIEDAMSAGRSRTVALREPIPVLLAYSTVVIKNSGKVYFFPDIYQQDGKLEQALRTLRPSN